MLVCSGGIGALVPRLVVPLSCYWIVKEQVLATRCVELIAPLWQARAVPVAGERLALLKGVKVLLVLKVQRA